MRRVASIKLVARLNTTVDRVIDSLAVLGALIIVGMMLIVSFNVVMRYFFHRPQIWMMEIVEAMLLWFTFLAAAWILKREGHVTVDILLMRLSPRTRALLAIISSIIGVIICSLLVSYGISVTLHYFQTGVTLLNAISLPLGPIIAIIPICSIPLGIQFIRRGYGYLQRWRLLPNKEPAS